MVATPSAITTVLAEGPLVILGSAPLPNPNPTGLAIHLSVAADEVVVRVWSPGLRLLAESHTLNVPAGWSQVPLPLEFLSAATNGFYFSSVTANRGERKALPLAPGKFQILR
jgi:hypothetical protein